MLEKMEKNGWISGRLEKGGEGVREGYVKDAPALVSWGCCTNQWLKTTESILSQFWRPEDQNRGVSGAMLSENSRGESILPFLFQLLGTVGVP